MANEASEIIIIIIKLIRWFEMLKSVFNNNLPQKNFANNRQFNKNEKNSESWKFKLLARFAKKREILLNYEELQDFLLVCVNKFNDDENLCEIFCLKSFLQLIF